MSGSTTQPRVFISYSWTSPQHERWVVEFAERLTSNGIVVVLDKWDLREGQDKHAFMEQMVNDPQIQKVLVICERGYQAKADNRQGGVGTETQLISKEVYDNTGQEKFIPVIRENDAEGKPCIPHFMSSRIYIDLSSEAIFEENYEKLIRNLYGKPTFKRPPLGPAPTFVTESEPLVLKTANKVRAIRDALINDRQSAKGLIAEYLSVFLDALEDFRLSGGTEPGFDDRIVEAIEKMEPLRNDFIDFVFTVFRYQKETDLDQFHTFLERLIRLARFPAKVAAYTEIDFDNYRVFNYELVLSFVSVLIQLGRYSELAYFLNATYFIEDWNSELKSLRFSSFNHYARSIDEIRNNRLKLNRASVTADIIRAHSTRRDLNFNEIQQSDLTLHYLTELAGQGLYYSWFPRTSAFQGGGKIPLFSKLISKRHFEKVKVLFGVQTPDELKNLIRNYLQESAKQPTRHPWYFEIRSLTNIINVDVIASLP